MKVDFSTFGDVFLHAVAGSRVMVCGPAHVDRRAVMSALVNERLRQRPTSAVWLFGSWPNVSEGPNVRMVLRPSQQRLHEVLLTRPAADLVVVDVADSADVAMGVLIASGVVPYLMGADVDGRDTKHVADRVQAAAKATGRFGDGQVSWLLPHAVRHVIHVGQGPDGRVRLTGEMVCPFVTDRTA